LFSTPERSAPYSYRDFCTNVWKGGNLMRHYGVRPGTRVAVVTGPKAPTDGDSPGYLRDAPDAVLAMLSAAIDGAVVDPNPQTDVDTTLLVGPAAWLDRYDLSPGTKAAAYGGPSDDPTVAAFERELWSENPLAPPGEIGPDDPAILDGEQYTHGELLTGAESVVKEYNITGSTTVALRAPITSAGAIVAGLLAPMRAGGTVRFGDDSPSDLAVAETDSVPESRQIRPENISL
jgi:acyl-CoA synthetase (AMP-forming)/AMP-acid ligase II